MKTPQELITKTALRYRKADRGGKTRILDDLVEWTQGDRSALARALRRTGPRGRWGGRRLRSGRKPTYGPEVLDPLLRVWRILHCPCGKRLAPHIEEMLDVLSRCGELRVNPVTRAQLARMSASTIDRLLAPERKRMELRGRSRTRSGGLLKSQIPLKTFADWDETSPGFVEVDLVSHDGGNTRDEFGYTLTLTDVATGWTQCRVVRNRAREWTLQALKKLRTRMPFPLLGLNSDNGSEFINHHLAHYCEQERITFTKSRPYRKNDNCLVEQKNNAVVRTWVGYVRFDTVHERGLMNRLYDLHRLWFNFFQPQMKLASKLREGAKVRRRHDTARTPHRRTLDSSVLDSAGAAALETVYGTLNPAQLHRTMLELQRQLWQHAAAKERRRQADDSEAL